MNFHDYETHKTVLCKSQMVPPIISQNMCCNDNNTYHLEKYFPVTLCEFSCNGKTSLTSGLLTRDPFLSFTVQYAA